MSLTVQTRSRDRLAIGTAIPERPRWRVSWGGQDAWLARGPGWTPFEIGMTE